MPFAWVSDWFAPAVASRRREARGTASGAGASPFNPEAHKVSAASIRGDWIESRHVALPSAMVPGTGDYIAFSDAVTDVLPSTYDLGQAYPGLESYWLSRVGAAVEASGAEAPADIGEKIRERPVGSAGTAPDAAPHIATESLKLVDPKYYVPPPPERRSALAQRSVARRHYLHRGRCFVEVEIQTIVNNKHFIVAAKSCLASVQQEEPIRRATVVEQERVARWALLLDMAYDAKFHGFDYEHGCAGAPGSASLPGSMPDPLMQLCTNEREVRHALVKAWRSGKRHLEAHGVALKVLAWRHHDTQFANETGPLRDLRDATRPDTPT